MIDLDQEEQALLRGAAVQEALQFQVEVGSFFEARRFVKINNAHVMGDIELMGDGGLHGAGRDRAAQACEVNRSNRLESSVPAG